MKDEEIREEVIQKLRVDILNLLLSYDANSYEKVYALHGVACKVYDTDNKGNKEHFFSFLDESLHECINEYDGWDKIQWPENQH
jgi:hypothetical protein